MDHQTQAFFGLLSDELTALISAALADQPLSSTDLAKATQTDPRVLAKHLEAMKLSAMVRSYRSPGVGSGRPRIYWEMLNTDLIDELAEFAIQLRHRLIDVDS